MLTSVKDTLEIFLEISADGQYDPVARAWVPISSNKPSEVSRDIRNCPCSWALQNKTQRQVSYEPKNKAWDWFKYTEWALILFLHVCRFSFFCSNLFHREEENNCLRGTTCILNCIFVLLGPAEVSGCDVAISNSFNLGEGGLNHLDRTENTSSIPQDSSLAYSIIV